MRSRSVVFLFCASLAAGLTSNVVWAQSCMPNFVGFSPTEVPAGRNNVALTLYGRCLPPVAEFRSNRVVFGFQPAMQVAIAIAEEKFIVLAVTTPSVTEDTRRRVWMQYRGVTYQGPEIIIKGPPKDRPLPPPVDLSPLRRNVQTVSGQADRAYGEAHQARVNAETANSNALAAQRAVTDLSAMLAQYLGDGATTGALETTIRKLRDGLVDHTTAIKDLQVQTDSNRRDIDRNANNEADDIDAVNRRIDAIRDLVLTLPSGVANRPIK